MAAVVSIPLAWRDTKALYVGKCCECGEYIARGDRIAYNPGTKAVRCGSCQDWATWTDEQFNLVAKLTVNGQIAFHLRTAGGIRRELAKELVCHRAEEARNETRHWRDRSIDLSHAPRVAREMKKHLWLIKQVRDLRAH